MEGDESGVMSRGRWGWGDGRGWNGVVLVSVPRLVGVGNPYPGPVMLNYGSRIINICEFEMDNVS